jgi:acyl-CoA thioester hydrolase
MRTGNSSYAFFIFDPSLLIMTEEINYPVELILRIDWSEMDLFGHVNNVSFFKYIQASRVNYWEKIGLTRMHEELKQGPMLASSACRFKKPLHYPGTISVQARIAYIRNTSFCIQHRIIDEQGDVAAEAEDIIVMFDYNTNDKIPFPAELRAVAENIEKRKL